MLFQVCGKDGFNDQEAETLELHMLQVGQEVVLGPRHEEVPGSRGVVVLQNRAVIVEHCLKIPSKRESKERTDEQTNSYKERTNTS